MDFRLLISVAFEALESEFGLVVKTNNPSKLRQRFYALAREYPEFKSLGYVLKNGELWIVKKEQPDAETT